jgi:flagella basal body P-ring formation protein FlgA|tara:strand:+ start:657 stop:1358 length:702 start_codon:yes stop_codon:yes gene_type:complete
MTRIFIFLLLASATALPAASKEITGSQLLPMVTEALQKTFEINDANLVLSPTRPLPTVPVPSDALVQVQIISHPSNGPTAFIRTQYALLVDGRRVGEWTGFFKAQLLKEVWLTGKIAARHTSLDKVKLIRKKVDVINLRTGVWEGKPNSTLQLTQGLGTGMVLLPRYVRRTPVIFRNQLVTGVLHYKALKIELRNLLALEEGAPGDTIRLRNNSSYKEIRGKIINGSSVQLSL